MPRWDKAAIVAEISRQIRWRDATIGRLQGERDYGEYIKGRLLARRAKYQAKNNGKGRPPKKIPEFSEAKQVCLSKSKIEAAYLCDLLPHLKAADRPQAVLAERLQDLAGMSAPSRINLIQLGLLTRLLQQFQRQPQPYQSQIAWSEREVRRYLELVRKMHRRKMGRLSRVTLHSDIERLEYDHHNAMNALLNQMLASNHLVNADRLAQVMNFWRVSSPVLKPLIASKAAWVWAQAVDRLWGDLSATFVTNRGL
jgi:hypothetical protein